MIKHVPGVAFAQRQFLTFALEGVEFVHKIDAGPARGLRFPVCLPQDKNVWTGAYEREFAELLSRSVEKDAICYDIGAWRGFFAGVCALAGASRVVCFEPLPANIVHLRRLMELNSGLPLELIDAAVSDVNGETEFVVHPSTSMGKLPGSSFQRDITGLQMIKAKVITLDSLVSSGRLSPPSVIKVDVEGAEMLVLRGATQILTSQRPKLFIEVHSKALRKECTAFLEERGYKIASAKEGRTMNKPEPEVTHIVAEARPCS